MRYSGKRARPSSSVLLLVLFAVLVFAAGFCAGWFTSSLAAERDQASIPAGPVPDASSPEPPASEPVQPPAPSDTPDPTAAAQDVDWRLVLVNETNPMDRGRPEPELTQLSNGHAIDSRAYPALQAMMDAARADGLEPLICSSYRTWETQEELFEREVRNYVGQGMSQEEAEAQAATWVAVPGTSEHQLGLALDIVDMSYQLLDVHQEETAVQQWLLEHCADYGFILRYPTDKSEITGINYEPWHYRYVGVETATAIMAEGLCLEEYLEMYGPNLAG